MKFEILTISVFQDDDSDAEQNILSSDEDEIDEEGAVYLESLQEKITKHCNGNLSVRI